jgi:hypothetical protein
MERIALPMAAKHSLPYLLALQPHLQAPVQKSLSNVAK